MSPRYVSPGVYVKEVDLSARAVAPVANGVPVFVGRTERASVDGQDCTMVPTRLASLREFVSAFGDKSRVGDAVRLFVENGGGPFWVVSVRGLGDSLSAAAIRRGLKALASCDEPDLLAIPESVDLGTRSYAVHRDALRHCMEHGRRLYLADLIERRTGDASFDWESGVVEFRRLLGIGVDLARFGAAYTPWLVLPDGRRVPPSGAAACVIAKTDRAHGVWKAPANAPVTGVAGLTEAIDHGTQAGLNVDPMSGYSINAIRAFPGRGILVWGARTLAGNDNEWRYVAVQRFATWCEASIRRSFPWAVFEPNDEPLWASVRGAVDAFLHSLWREGALQGTTPRDAWFVQTGLGSTMTARDLAEGRIVVLAGLAIVKPAEFAVLRISLPALRR